MSDTYTARHINVRGLVRCNHPELGVRVFDVPADGALRGLAEPWGLYFDAVADWDVAKDEAAPAEKKQNGRRKPTKRGATPRTPRKRAAPRGKPTEE